MKEIKIRIERGQITSVDGKGWIEGWVHDMLYQHDASQFPGRHELHKKIMAEVIGPNLNGKFFDSSKPFSDPMTPQNLLECVKLITRWKQQLIRVFNAQKPAVIYDGAYLVTFEEGVEGDKLILKSTEK